MIRQNVHGPLCKLWCNTTQHFWQSYFFTSYSFHFAISPNAPKADSVNTSEIMINLLSGFEVAWLHRSINNLIQFNNNKRLPVKPERAAFEQSNNKSRVCQLLPEWMSVKRNTLHSVSCVRPEINLLIANKHYQFTEHNVSLGQYINYN